MLPQFGFIVAQAGADSRSLPPPPPTSKQQQSMIAHPPRSPPTDPSAYYAPVSSTMPAPLLPPPTSRMYASGQLPPPPAFAAQSSADEYHKSSYYDARPPDLSFRPLQPLPPPPPPPTTSTPPPVAPLPYPSYDPYRPASSVWHTPQTYAEPLPPPPSSQQQDYYEDDPYHSPYSAPWSQDEWSESKVRRRQREYDDLIAWMDNEFWEQSEGVYREKLATLQDELKTIQEGTHTAFQDLVADLEYKRELTVEDAAWFMKYQLHFAQRQYEHDQNRVEEEYENERHNLHDMVMMAIGDWRKRIKEDKEDTVLDIQDLFSDAYARVSSKRTPRKRQVLDRASPSRQEMTRRRQNRPSTPYDFNAQPSSREAEELESDLMNMKGVLPARRLGASGNVSRR